MRRTLPQISRRGTRSHSLRPSLAPPTRRRPGVCPHAAPHDGETPVTAGVSEVFQPPQSFFRAVCQIMLFSAAAFVITAVFFFSLCGSARRLGGIRTDKAVRQLRRYNLRVRRIQRSDPNAN